MNNHYPTIENQEEKLKKVCEKRLFEVYKRVTQSMKKRLKYELDDIKQTETTAIFILLNQAFINLDIKPYQFAPRGLTGGSLVAYLCGFSNVDPIKYKLNQYIYFGLKEKYKERYKELFRNHNLPEWFSKTYVDAMYLLPRAHAVSYTLIAWKLLWFKIHYDKEYKKVINKIQTDNYYYKGEAKCIKLMKMKRNI